jgi:two-component system alkaline phosphatase synthesis response regulator PhoP
MAKILVIDDEPSIINLVSAYLKPEGYEVFTAADGNAGLKAARAFKPDLIILDLMLPGMDGIELLSRLRRESDVYVIMLTARTEETDKIVGLSVGADDYVTKPFSPRELVARVKAALRRLKTGAGPGEARSVLSFKHIHIDVDAHIVSVDEVPIALSLICCWLWLKIMDVYSRANNSLKKFGALNILARCVWWMYISGTCAKNLGTNLL